MADSTRRVSVRLSLDDAARVKTGLREVGETGQRSLEQIQGGADVASRALGLLDVAARGIQIAGVAVAARALVQAGDALTQSMSRLGNAVGSVERASQVYEALYRDALRTGVAVTEGVDAFQRFSIATREISATSDEVLRLVGGLQRVAIASGASGSEIAGSTLQLAQALASGVLQGDELRSILEGLPTLAQALAGELGVSIGELRKLGSEGKLTADTVFPALLRAVERVNGEFERAPLSVGRAFGQLTAAADQFLARLDQAVGVSNTLARALSGAAGALDGVRRGSGLLMPGEQVDDRRRQAEALRAEIARLEAEAEGASLRAQPRRGSIRAGLAGTAAQQAGVDRAGRLEELRRQYAELAEEVARGEREAEARGAAEREAAAARATEARRRRAAEDAEELRRAHPIELAAAELFPLLRLDAGAAERGEVDRRGIFAGAEQAGAVGHPAADSRLSASCHRAASGRAAAGLPAAANRSFDRHRPARLCSPRACGSRPCASRPGRHRDGAVWGSRGRGAGNGAAACVRGAGAARGCRRAGEGAGRSPAGDRADPGADSRWLACRPGPRLHEQSGLARG